VVSICPHSHSKKPFTSLYQSSSRPRSTILSPHRKHSRIMRSAPDSQQRLMRAPLLALFSYLFATAAEPESPSPVLTADDLEKGYRRCSRTTSQLLVDRTSNHRLLVARTDFGNAPLPDSEPGASSPQHPGGARADRSTTGAIYITATAAATGKTNTVCFTQSNLLPLLTICRNSLSPP
jgi:hypothetical protein